MSEETAGRIVERFEDDQWVQVPFQHLKKGDAFRIFQDGIRYADPATGNNVWIASSHPYEGKDAWHIDTTY